MSWYDSIATAAGSWWETASDGLDQYLDAKLDRATEQVSDQTQTRLNDSTSVPVYQSPSSVTPDQGHSQIMNINWQTTGIVVAGIAGTIAAIKLLKG